MKKLFLTAAVAALLAAPVANAQAVLGWGAIGGASATSGAVQTSSVNSGAALAGIAGSQTSGLAAGHADATGAGVGALGLGVSAGGASATANHAGVNQQTTVSGALGLAASTGTGNTVQENVGIGSGLGFGGFGVILP